MFELEVNVAVSEQAQVKRVVNGSFADVGPDAGFGFKHGLGGKHNRS
jgi:hypothetical protein